MDLDHALFLSETLISHLASGCKRIEVAGSVRREKPEPGDIEIVVVPDLSIPKPIFGQRLCKTVFEQVIHSLGTNIDGIQLRQSIGGDRFKKFWVSQDGGQSFSIKLDLFICVPPSDWGVLYLIRTGPRDFSQWMVTEQRKGGALPNGYHIEGNQVLTADGKSIPMPEEIDFLRFCGLDYIEPSKRKPLWHKLPTRLYVPRQVKI
jgi:DNA polymerase/3'-5' exonuclease PolX